MRLRLTLVSLALLLLAPFEICPAQTTARKPGELAWVIAYDPKTFDPAKVDEQGAELVRYLTAGVLLRFNRHTQQVTPELAESYTLSPDGRTLTLKLRRNLQFSDGTPLTSRDAAFSLRRVLLPATAAPVAEEFINPAGVTIDTPDALTVVVHLPVRVVSIAKVLDEIAIEPTDRPSEARITAGPFAVADYRRGQSIRLQRNDHFWRHDASGTSLPYASAIRLDILSNREREIALFQRGEYDLIDGIQPDYFSVLSQSAPNSVRDLGPTLNTEQLWFNEAAAAPLPAYEKAWFQSQAFRVAVSRAIHRSDLARVAYGGHATPANSFISPANRTWHDKALSAATEDVNAARAMLADAGFKRAGDQLTDAAGHPVKFSILTNAGNVARLKMATLIQQDLAALGMEVRVVSLDFPALIERLLHTQDYQACLLGLANVEPDPDSMMNIWLSSSPNHQFNPGEKQPATPWEAEIDRLMNVQATAATLRERKQAIDRVQQIVSDQQPFIYLVHPNALYAISPRLQGVDPAILQPGIVWNIENLRLAGTR